MNDEKPKGDNEKPKGKTLKEVIAEIDVLTLYVNGKEMGEYRSFGIMLRPDKTGRIDLKSGPDLRTIPKVIMTTPSSKRRSH